MASSAYSLPNGLPDRSPAAVFEEVRTQVFAPERDDRLQALARDPVALMEAAGLRPDPWQRDVLRSRSRRLLLNITRQGGKSTTTAVKALHRALFTRRSLVLLLSPSLRQSQELFAKVLSTYEDAGRPVPAESASTQMLRLTNGSRIIALPGNEKTIRGFSGVDLLVIDEASRVDDALYYSVRPMLAVSGGELMAMTTPFGKRGFFYQEWTEGGEDWTRVQVAADKCPRITADFLAEERRRLGELWYRQEYFCEFIDLMGSLFHFEDIEAAFTSDFEPFLRPADDVTTDAFERFIID